MRLRVLEAEDAPHCLSAWPLPEAGNDLVARVVERGLAKGRLPGTISRPGCDTISV